MPKHFLPLLVLSMVCCWIEVDISVPGFPDMAKYFKVDEAMIQYTLAVNFLGFCLASIIIGPLSDAFGKRKVMIIGNLIMAIGACGCYVAGEIEYLLLARFVQGCGAATSAIIVTTMITDVYKGAKATQLIGLMNAIATILIALAPPIGSVINKFIGWQGNYGLVVIISILSWVLISLFLPETSQAEKDFSWKSVIGDYWMLINNSRFMLKAITPSLLYASSMVFTASSSFLYMQTFGYELLEYGINQTLIIAVFSAVSFNYGRINKRLADSQIIILGCCLTMVGPIIGFLFSNYSIMVTLSMMIYAAGFALYYPPVFTQSLEIYPDLKGTASSLIMSMRSFLVTATVAIGSVLYNNQASSIFIVMLPIAFIVMIITYQYIIKIFEN